MPRIVSVAGRAALIAILVSLFPGLVARAQQYETIHNLGANKDGAFPDAGLVFDAHGDLYTTTTLGGAQNLGAAVALKPDGNGGWRSGVIHSFGSGNDGQKPFGGLAVDASGNLYGATGFGGAYGLGTIFELTSTSSDGWTEKILHSFRASPKDGAYPYAGVILDSAGNIYTTTNSGGQLNFGTVFELKRSAAGTWQPIVLLSFNGKNGESPYSGLTMDAAGNIYGTTIGGGAYNYGIVFVLRKSGSSWVETALHSFANNGVDGVSPFAGVTLDASGNLYGTTYNGGSLVYGTVYELSRSSGGEWMETILHNFNVNGVDAYATYAGVVFDAAGNLYGTSEGGGFYNAGTIYELSPQSDGSWSETILHSFNNTQTDGYNPDSTLVLDPVGNLYGTAYDGGIYSGGTVFEITP